MHIALRLAQNDLNNYKQVEKEWNMNEEVKVKRPRGNPNFVKKNKPENVDVAKATEGTTILTPSNTNERHTYKYQYIDSEANVWLSLFSAIIGTYNTSGTAVIAQAASGADLALAEYTKRYPK